MNTAIKLTMDLTAMVVYTLILIAGIYDLTVIVFKGRASSISGFLISTAFKSPLVNFAFGCTAGHLFFYMFDVNCKPDWSERMLIAVCGYGFLRGVEYLGKTVFSAYGEKK